jgi:hypothetical protein
MITFETYAEFEEAVMEVIQNRLEVGVAVSKVCMDYYGDSSTKVEVQLRDKISCD